MKCLPCCLVAVAMLSLAPAARATIIPLAYYRLGETDSGASAGNTGNNPTDDAANANDLARIGSPVYASSVAATAVTATGSTLAMNFGSTNTANYYNRTSGALATGTANFVMEGWFNFANTGGSPVLMLNGNGSFNGSALLLNGGQVNVLLPGSGFLNTGFAPTLNTWFYVALVKQATNLSVYINNNAPLNYGAIGINTPSGWFTIGANGGGGLYMSGLADEVRVSTIVPGTFNATTDLLINQVPEPSSLSMLLFGTVALWLIRRKR